MHTLLDGLLNTPRETPTQQQPQQDLHTVLGDAEAVLADTASRTHEHLDRLRTQMAQSIAQLKQRLAAEEAALLVQAKSAMTATNHHAHGHPWQWIAGAAVAGFAIGWLSQRPR